MHKFNFLSVRPAYFLTSMLALLLAGCAVGGGSSGVADSCSFINNSTQNDNDLDGFTDSCDVDDNNNGLIEIRTLDDLARLRDDLDGNGTDDGNIDEITAVGSIGCPPAGCVGYELTRSLNFSLAASYKENSGNRAVWTSGSGWQPIGSCSGPDNCTAWTGVFDGGGYTLTGLFVSADNRTFGVGLFGAFAGRLQNLHLRDASVNGGALYVGSLAGYGGNAGYEYLSVTASRVMSPSAGYVGGLIGDGRNANIRYANVSGTDVAGDSDVGGLVGLGYAADIRYARTSGGSVAGNRSRVGGLVGVGLDADIRDAYVSGTNVSGRNEVGGLVGVGEEADIRNAYVSGTDVAGRNDVGGLVGVGREADIRNAYAYGGSVTGNRRVGGLVGHGSLATIRYSYAATGPVSANRSGGGLIGSVYLGAPAVTDSYWDNQTTGQPSGGVGSGSGQTTFQLQYPTGFTGIYESWGNLWCNPATGEQRTNSSQPSGFVPVWDLGRNFQYPVLNCLPVSAEQQRQNHVQDPNQDQDLDNIPNEADACPTGVTGWTSTGDTDADGDGCRDSDEDAFPTDACANIDTDNDNQPDRLVAGCATDLTEDTDDDNDSLADEADACPAGVTGWNSTDSNLDSDADGCRDSDEDRDDDNNGLMEIDNLDELALLRDDLHGEGRDSEGNLATRGCPQSGCLGYELTRSLDFEESSSYATGSANMDAWTMDDLGGWTPIGSCSAGSSSQADDCVSYTGIFDGNHYDIDHLRISADDDTNGVGLFGAVTGTIQNLDLLNVFVGGGANAVGMLAGYGSGARFQNISATGRVDSPGARSVGGLVGFGERVTIRDSDVSVFRNSVLGSGSIGGLVGHGSFVTIRDSHVSGSNKNTRSVHGRGNAGGLIGFGPSATIRDSRVTNAEISGTGSGGGLIGYGPFATIRDSRVSDVGIRGGFVGGGLIGSGSSANISYSNVSGDTFDHSRISFSNDIEGAIAGGLVGLGSFATIRSSHASAILFIGRDGIGGLVGLGTSATIRYAYASNSMIGVGDQRNCECEVTGGLIGYGRHADIRYAYVSGLNNLGKIDVGGLVGSGRNVTIRYAYVSGGSVEGSNRDEEGNSINGSVGGLVGDGSNGQVHYSYAAAGRVSGARNAGGLIGFAGFAENQTIVTNSYWDNQTTEQATSGGDLGNGQTTTELQSPTSFTGIYASWGNFWCNPNTGEERTSSSRPTGFDPVWDLGSSTQYPALNCMPGGLSAQGR